ncbi:MAG TPA: hypothetical protein VKT74_04290 [Gammaproteobacteria bacterium]|nr:hypothetical protein [Gammaproteobacteria bacterium]
MRVLDRPAASVTGRNAQHLGRWTLWLLTPASVTALTLSWLAFAPHWTWQREILCAVLGFMAFCLALSVWSQERFWWAPRALAAVVTLGCVAAVLRVVLFPMAGGAPRAPAVFLASVAFMVWGLPCLCFALWGHTRGKLVRADAVHVTRMDRWTAHLLPALAWGTGIALGIYLLRLIVP